MQPRVLFRTHYQVDEPAFGEAVVALCTSPVESSYDDTVAERLSRNVKARGKSFNIAAAGYAVDLARGLALVNSNNVWDQNGHLVSLVAEVGKGPWDDELSLTFTERLLHFRLFLEADGAALLFLARLFLSERHLPFQGLDWNLLARNLFIQTYSEYLEVTSPTADRVSLRSDIDRFRQRGYAGKSGSHKLFLHLQTLHRLKLIDRLPGSGERRYAISEKKESRLGRLVTEIPNVHVLEDIVREHRYIEVAARVYGLVYQPEVLTSSEALRRLLPAYRQIMDTGVAICPIAPIIEAAQISLLAEKSGIVGYSEFLDLLSEEQAIKIRDIRFHQDRQGRIAFLRISDDLIRDMTTQDALPDSCTILEQAP